MECGCSERRRLDIFRGGVASSGSWRTICFEDRDDTVGDGERFFDSLFALLRLRLSGDALLASVMASLKFRGVRLCSSFMSGLVTLERLSLEDHSLRVRESIGEGGEIGLCSILFCCLE